MPKSLSARSERTAQPAGIISEPGNPACATSASRGIAASAEPPGREIKRAHIGHLRRLGPRPRGAFIVAAARQPGKPLLVEDLGDGRRAEGATRAVERGADIIDGEVLFAQGDDLFAHPVFLRSGRRPVSRSEEKGSLGVLAKPVAEHAEAIGGVAEAPSDLGGGPPVDEIGAQGFVLTVGGVGGFEEEAGEIRYLIGFTGRHASTISNISTVSSRKRMDEAKSRKIGSNQGYTTWDGADAWSAFV